MASNQKVPLATVLNGLPSSFHQTIQAIESPVFMQNSLIPMGFLVYMQNPLIPMGFLVFIQNPLIPMGFLIWCETIRLIWPDRTTFHFPPYIVERNENVKSCFFGWN